MRKCNLTDTEICTEFLPHMEEHPTKQYPHWLVKNRSVLCTWVTRPCSKTIHRVGTHRQSTISMFTGDMCEIKTVLTKIYEINGENESYTILISGISKCPINPEIKCRHFPHIWRMNEWMNEWSMKFRYKAGTWATKAIQC